MSRIRLPGLVDVHTHMRDPGQTHKEDWASGTAAALAGGFTAVLAMPNTVPAVIDEGSLRIAGEAARSGARVDYGLFVGGTDGNAVEVPALAERAAGLKLYLDQTFGELKLSDPAAWMRHLEAWPQELPVSVHAEGSTLDAVLDMARALDRPLHVCHVSARREIESIRRARDSGAPITCEVAPHHLTLTAGGISGQRGRSSVRPPLGTPEDVAALWQHLEAIDCFATDHAPHTVAEKESQDPPPGFPGLETALAVLLGAVHDGLIDIDGVITRLCDNPRRIYRLPEQSETYVEVDPDERWVVDGSRMQTKSRWSPFEGMEMRGRVRRVVLRGSEAYRDGEVLGTPGSGHDMREAI
jgi:carbamoyl-phosphate synthase / aspartate carbamoyltransferase / dihydroorotase